MGHSSWNQNPMFLWGGLQRKVFLLRDSSAHRTQGVNLRAALKAGKGRRSLPTSAKAFEVCHPHPGNCKHWLLATASHSTELHAPSSYAPGPALSWTPKLACCFCSEPRTEPFRNQRTEKCVPVKWYSACSYAATSSLAFQVQKCVQHSADSTELSTCHLLVTSNKACIFLSSAQSRTLRHKSWQRESAYCLEPWSPTKEWDCVCII